jgi:HK97 family phage portal protein
MQRYSEDFFANLSQPGGILSTAHAISNETAERIERNWEAKSTGPNRGRTLALGDDLKFTPIAFTADESQLIEQMKLTVEDICRAFKVPLWKVGGPLPPYGNVQAANVEYYSVALQNLMEHLELCLDRGLNLPKHIGVSFDITGLLRMDTATQMDIAAKGVGSAIYSPNEGRAEFDKRPVTGGETPYLQEQNWPLAHLAKRELPTRPVTPPTDPEPREDTVDDVDKRAADLLRKALGLAA